MKKPRKLNTFDAVNSELVPVRLICNSFELKIFDEQLANELKPQIIEPYLLIIKELIKELEKEIPLGLLKSTINNTAVILKKMV